jgi:hypothetical protein
MMFFLDQIFSLIFERRLCFGRRTWTIESIVPGNQFLYSQYERNQESFIWRAQTCLHDRWSHGTKTARESCDSGAAMIVPKRSNEEGRREVQMEVRKNVLWTENPPQEQRCFPSHAFPLLTIMFIKIHHNLRFRTSASEYPQKQVRTIARPIPIW